MSDSQDRVPTRDLFVAIGRKAWNEVEDLTAVNFALEVHAAPGVRSRRNERLWRAVSLQGREALRDYLAEVHEAMPGLNVEAHESASPSADEPQVVRADCVGVDNTGSPFDAQAQFTIWSSDGVLHRVEARVDEVTVGSEVIRRGERDPRRYFRHFLDDSTAPA